MFKCVRDAVLALNVHKPKIENGAKRNKQSMIIVYFYDILFVCDLKWETYVFGSQ